MTELHDNVSNNDSSIDLAGLVLQWPFRSRHKFATILSVTALIVTKIVVFANMSFVRYRCRTSFCTVFGLRNNELIVALPQVVVAR